MNPNPDDFLLIGHVSIPFGIRGELKVITISSRPDHLTTLKTVYLGNQFKPYSVERFHQHKVNMFLVGLQGVASRDDAETLRGSDVFIHMQDAAPLAEHEYFFHDLIGLQVETIDGTQVGHVTGFIETGANDVLIVRNSDQVETLIPMLKHIIQKINIAGQTIIVSPLETIIPR